MPDVRALWLPVSGDYFFIAVRASRGSFLAPQLPVYSTPFPEGLGLLMIGVSLLLLQHFLEEVPLLFVGFLLADLNASQPSPNVRTNVQLAPGRCSARR